MLPGGDRGLMTRLRVLEPSAAPDSAIGLHWRLLLEAARVDVDVRRVRDLIRICETVIRRAGLTGFNSMGSVREDARAIVFETLAIRDHSDAYLDAAVTALERGLILDLLAQRVGGPTPLPYLLGEAFFCGRRFLARPGVFIPRSALGRLLDELLGEVSWSPTPRVLELGCGTGALGLTIALRAPHAHVELTDIDPLAVAVSQDNVDRFRLSDRVRLVVSDLFDGIDPASRYDLVVANLPYVPEGRTDGLSDELSAEPASAIYRPGDGLDLVRAVLSCTAEHLADRGLLALEVGTHNQPRVAELLSGAGHWWSLRGQPAGVVTLTHEQLRALSAQV